MSRKMDDEVQLQVMSDLHLETPQFMPMYSGFSIVPRCKILALLGDIGNVHDVRLFDFLKQQLLQFKLVFYILGNHEPYEGSLQAAISKMKTFETTHNKARMEAAVESSPLGQFVFMNRRRFDLTTKVTILGCTLFSKITEEQHRTVALFVTDFWSIKDWSVDTHNAAHLTDLAWLDAEVQSITHTEPDRTIIILTHFSPTTDAMANDPEHLEDTRGVSSAFVTDLAKQLCWTNNAVKLWVFGHTHHNCNYIDDRTGKRIISNQRGYGREDIYDFDADMIVSLPDRGLSTQR